MDKLNSGIGWLFSTSKEINLWKYIFSAHLLQQCGRHEFLKYNFGKFILRFISNFIFHLKVRQFLLAHSEYIHNLHSSMFVYWTGNGRHPIKHLEEDTLFLHWPRFARACRCKLNHLWKKAARKGKQRWAIKVARFRTSHRRTTNSQWLGLGRVTEGLQIASG